MLIIFSEKREGYKYVEALGMRGKISKLICLIKATSSLGIKKISHPRDSNRKVRAKKFPLIREILVLWKIYLFIYFQSLKRIFPRIHLILLWRHKSRMRRLDEEVLLKQKLKKCGKRKNFLKLSMSSKLSF